jgi:hypothetical protein
MKTKSMWVAICVLLSISVSFGQVQLRRLQTDITGSAGVSFESWKAKDNKVTEISVPVMFIYPVNPKMSLYAMTSPVSSNLEAGRRYSLSGLSDLKWGGHFLTMNDRLLITLGVNLPTGKHALAVEEYSVASALSVPAFNFRTPTLGQGFDVQLGANSAMEAGSFILGYGASYIMKGKFKPLKEYEQDYDPGDEITLTAGVDRNTAILGKDMQIRGDVLYTLYFDDSWGGQKVFKSGNRLLIQLYSRFMLGSRDAALFIRERIKGKNTTGSGKTYATERLNSNANQFEVQGWAWFSSGRNYGLKGLFDVKLYSDSDYNTGGAALFGLGGGGRFRLSPNLWFNGDLRYYFGKIKTSVEKIDAAGIKLFGGFECTL